MKDFKLIFYIYQDNTFLKKYYVFHSASSKGEATTKGCSEMNDYVNRNHNGCRCDFIICAQIHTRVSSIWAYGVPFEPGFFS
jgi:hypothetical protein